jgi:predicted Zn-dependent protease
MFPILPDEVGLGISIEQEEKIGTSIYKLLVENNPEFEQISHPTVNSALEVIKERLIAGMNYSSYTYKLVLVKNKQVNAYSLPGGYIIICRGLFEFIDSPEELAAVIAHEMGHIEKKHLVSRIIKEFGISLLVSGDAMILGEIGKLAASTAFDRKQEKEADQFALKLLEKSRINPRMLAFFFRKLSTKGLSFDKRLELLMSHPHNSSRIKAAFEYKLTEAIRDKLE